jgi:hypothetical protein
MQALLQANRRGHAGHLHLLVLVVVPQLLLVLRRVC